MGKKDKNKKKGKGAEKTIAKTEKKLLNKQKKELAQLGEDDIEATLAEIEREEQKRLKVIECVVAAPSRRINFSFVAHPDKEELILFGGEYFNGQKTSIYNELYFYNIKNNTWTLVKAPGAPPPRCGHQMVATSANKGQLWVFGGEFASATQSQFYHYRDLWVFNLPTKQWQKILSPNGPSARSGHRMVYVKKQLIVFGGFHDNLRDYKYFNDLYSFNTESHVWTKIEATGSIPLPRSACCMMPLNDGKILIYGGYSKEKVKKDVDKGHLFTDSYTLSCTEKNDAVSWKWISIKIGGMHFSPRCSISSIAAPNNIGYIFGGVFDTEDDEDGIKSTFFNDLYSLDLEKPMWNTVTLTGKKDKASKPRRRKIKEGGDEMESEIAEECEEDMDVDVEEISQKTEETKISDDGVFTVTVGPSPSVSNMDVGAVAAEKPVVFQPSPRINSGLAIKHGILYLYGGMFEENDKQLTLNDFYAFDLRKMDEWKILTKDEKPQEWLETDSESEADESESDDEETSEEDEQ